MIVPLIEYSEIAANDQEIGQTMITRLGLLGRVGLQLAVDCDRPQLIQFVVAVGGQVDLQVKLADFEDDFALELLNAGADKILVESMPADSSVPADRLSVVRPILWTEVVAAKVANDWRSGVETIAIVESDDVDELNELIADVLVKILKSDRTDGLWPTVIVDRLGIALGLAYSSAASLRQAICERIGVYFSRSRNEIWVKGKTSGAVQSLHGIRIDCDFDTIRFQVDQGPPGFCHQGTHTCFGYERNISEVVARLEARITGEDTKSFTKKLYDDPEMLRKKLLEEALELSDAQSQDEAHWEAADVLYFSLIALMRNNASLDGVYQELARRMQRVVRRKNKLEQ